MFQVTAEYGGLESKTDINVWYMLMLKFVFGFCLRFVNTFLVLKSKIKYL